MITQAWKWIINCGVSDAHPDQHELIRCYNGIAILSAAGAASVAIASTFMGYPSVHMLCAASIMVLYLGVVWLNYLGHFIFVRYYAAVGTALWVSICNLLIGGHFGQGVAILTAVAITFAVFPPQPKIRISCISFSVLSFVCSTLYVGAYGPLVQVVDFPYDELVVFAGSASWALLILHEFTAMRDRLVKDLKAKNEQLQRTTEELERFTHIASHDLKSPLRTIISFVTLAERKMSQKHYAEAEEHLNFVKTGAQQLNFLVQDILEYSKLGTYRSQTHEYVDLNLVFKKARQNLREDIREKQAIVRCTPLPSVMGAEVEFVLLFQNLIQNGIKYNHRKPPEISISSRPTDDHWELIFTDNGIGIEARYHTHIFQFFKRLHTSEQYPGTGLGLGLCKKIVESYQGTIEVDSQPGQGSIFTLSFPIEQVRPRVTAAQAVAVGSA
ncbi:MAG: hypothetical protein D6772_13235 [Bacteroidetes bacterium]|nr:MAG: hypothetical protein D6772_13235 [Bacteroidota bacterium]